MDTRIFIFETLRDKVKNNYSPLEVMFMTILRHFNQFYSKEGVNHMDSEKQQKYIWVLYKSAEQVRNKIGLKKAQGMAYRLLNSVQAGNRNTFMDTVMRVYISSELEMPSILLEALHEKSMDFETVANAWVSGLISKPNEEGEFNNV
ncbi:type I-B CRISPR-associated protein Cas8b1/Cst1 [Lentibacillus cibarius]|uniref:type I-B CRISPR-associated protein Cas8b1/Cst1 n=1 Tax=Lentibacillus cibarius TaxID=2583219 RepID=UPI001487524F|nr:type I-B CRISPR-associated protein Cas8b1/Cst1 [Lentibacillus cibarius]